MVFKIAIIIVILIIIFVSYIFYSNNKSKHRKADSKKSSNSYYKDELDSFSILSKDSFKDTHIKEFLVNEGIILIEDKCFVNCKNLNQIVIPENVEEIHPRAFNLCPRLTIRCYKNSIADDYCKKYYIPCEYLSS